MLRKNAPNLEISREKVKAEIAALRLESDKNGRMFKSLYENLISGLITGDEYRDIFDLAATGKSTGDIVKVLYENKISTPAEYRKAKGTGFHNTSRSNGIWQSNLITAIYCRSATINDDAVAAQEIMLRNYAEEHGYCNVAVYVDNGYGGLDFNRPAFGSLDADINAGLVGAVLVKDTSRVSRNYQDIFAWFDSILEKGILFISVLDNLNSNSFVKNLSLVRPRKKSRLHVTVAAG